MTINAPILPLSIARLDKTFSERSRINAPEKSDSLAGSYEEVLEDAPKSPNPQAKK